MARFALGIEYDGTDFVGWQAQQNGRSVQAELQTAVGRVAGESVTIHGAGRTDAGVHAANQVAHFDARAERSERQWLLGINSNLPDDVAVNWIRPVDSSFDARRSALSRSYRYTLSQSATRPVLARRTVWWIRETLDCAAMTSAAVYWLGERDFSSFRAAHCQSQTAMRYLERVEVTRCAAAIVLNFRANAFLYHMVRNMVGTLVEIGRGRIAATEAARILASRDRGEAAVTAPAAGLMLQDVRYPLNLGLPNADGAVEVG
jgi:tRNA pseudouridine38-40 synthase